jgi:exonuclease V gamma subunit
LTASARRDPFATTRLVVPQRALATRLELEFARRLGVCTGFQFLTPAEAFATLLPELADDVPRELRWRIAERLEHDPPQTWLSALTEPFAELKRHRLAQAVARRIDGYAMWRPADALRGVPFVPPDDPQRALWQTLESWLLPRHRGPLLERLRQRFCADDPALRALDWHWFLLSAPPEPQWQTLRSLINAGAPITLYQHTPTALYLGDSVRTKRQPYPPDDLPRLLAQHGQRLAELQDTLLELDTVEAIERFVPNAREGSLAALKALLFDGSGERPANTEQTLRIALGASELDELRWLKRQLIDAFNRDPTLEPREVLVLAVDVDRYGPLLAGVFAADASLGEAALPFTLSDGQQATVRLWQHLQFSFRLELGTFDRDTLEQLLLEPAYLAALGIDARSAREALDALVAAGFRFGLNSAARAHAGLGDDPDHSLTWAFDRLLLGVSGSAVEHAGIAAHQAGAIPLPLLATLDALRTDLLTLAALGSTIDTPEGWRDRLSDWLARRYHDDALSEILRTLAADLDAAIAATPAARLGIGAIAVCIATGAESTRRGSAFLAGAITVSALVPLRAVPARIVVLLGVSAGAFPRAAPHDPLDWLKREPRRAERDVRRDDSQLFLEAVSAAQEQLWITGIARSPSDLGTRPLAPVLDDLIADLQQVGVARDSVVEWLEPIAILAPVLPWSRPLRTADAPPATLPLRRLARALRMLPRRYVESAAPLLLADESRAPERLALDALDRWALGEALLKSPTLTFTQARARGLLALSTDADVFALACAQVAELNAVVDRAALRRMRLRVAIDQTHLIGSTWLDLSGNAWRIRAGKLGASALLEGWVHHLALNLAQPLARTTLVGFDEGVVKVTLNPVAPARRELSDLFDLYRCAEVELLGFYPEASLARLNGQQKGVDEALKAAAERDPAVAFAIHERADQLDADLAHYAERVFKPLFEARA